MLDTNFYRSYRPTPSLEEMEEAAISFCGLEWDSLLKEFKESKTHPYTREAQLPDRCFEALYIITLLEKGFAFDRFSRTITYALEVHHLLAQDLMFNCFFR